MSEEAENPADENDQARKVFVARVGEAEKRLSSMTTERLQRLLQIGTFDLYSRVAAFRILRTRKDLDPRARMLWRCWEKARKSL